MGLNNVKHDFYSMKRGATQIVLRTKGTDKYIKCDLVPVKCTPIFVGKVMCALEKQKGQGHTSNN